uniref:Uncharacterized protein n=1 Tax=Populus trichocarpa TaxID=3694 RepID=A9PCB8_POPTR|nr:unknown [Populus trichocarpa]
MTHSKPTLGKFLAILISYCSFHLVSKYFDFQSCFLVKFLVVFVSVLYTSFR